MAAYYKRQISADGKLEKPKCGQLLHLRDMKESEFVNRIHFHVASLMQPRICKNCKVKNYKHWIKR